MIRQGTLRGARPLALCLLAAPVLADDPPPPPPDPRAAGFHFHGYLRSGYGVNGAGDPQEAFQAPNANAKYRLGNETEAYVETTFDYGLAPPDDQDVFFGHLGPLVERLRRPRGAALLHRPLPRPGGGGAARGLVVRRGRLRNPERSM